MVASECRCFLMPGELSLEVDLDEGRYKSTRQLSSTFFMAYFISSKATPFVPWTATRPPMCSGRRRSYNPLTESHFKASPPQLLYCSLKSFVSSAVIELTGVSAFLEAAYDDKINSLVSQH